VIPAATGTSEPASSDVRRGVMMGAAHVLTVVINTERATSACIFFSFFFLHFFFNLFFHGWESG
jgi:hypothetical protein